ncbi:hypothetical protein BYT27DRAFT_7254401 [Phlegmacium glaucopus]|nr:hypothetical protein BYT27DRAFT_7254401 [Phlegmacium glaucopus]
MDTGIHIGMDTPAYTLAEETPAWVHRHTHWHGHTGTHTPIITSSNLASLMDIEQDNSVDIEDVKEADLDRIADKGISIF